MMDSIDNFPEAFKNLINGKNLPEKNFILKGQGYESIYSLAGGIRSRFPSDSTLCLYTVSKSVIISALLASMAGGPVIIMPYSINEHVLHEVHNSVGFNYLLSDTQQKVPEGFDLITPEECGKNNINLFSPRNPDDIFLKLFTGGSTGRPKVWSKSPGNLLTEAFFLSQFFNISEKDIFASTVPPNHIYGLLFSVLVPFISSAAVLDDIFAYPGEIINAVKNNLATVLISVPMHYRILRGGGFSTPSLRLAFSSGGKLDNDDAGSFFQNTNLKVAEIYGSTETGGIAYRYNSGSGGKWSPFESVKWKIKNERLCVSSDYISQELFRDNDGFYITGDRAEHEDESGFNLLGRADGIVKVGGKRVDINKIQEKLRGMSGINDAVVISMPSDKGRENIIAALYEGSVEEDEVKKRVSKIIEDYELPRKIKRAQKIPSTSTGKYDHQKIEKILKL